MIPAPEPAPPRRSERPLPARRHLPGEGPHPKTEGFAPEADWDWACDLFDHRFYWEAHEVWEACWAPLDKRSTDAALLQGLICAAAFVVKRHQGVHDGAGRLLARSRDRLTEVVAARGAVVRGVDLPALLDRLEAFAEGGVWPTLPTR